MHTTSEWVSWANSPFLPEFALQAPQVEKMPAMARRRLNRLGRMAAQVCYETRREPSETSPLVLCSRYGDAGRSLALLADLANEQAVSPTAFGLSVHNAIGALIAITRADKADATAIAGGACNAGQGLIESLARLQDPGVTEVTLVCYDEPLPHNYHSFQDEALSPFAWAWRLARPADGEVAIRLSMSPLHMGSSDAPPLPFDLALLRFGIGASQACTLTEPTSGTWSLTRWRAA